MAPMRTYYLFFAILTVTACPTIEPTELHPCAEAEHCIYDADRGESNCREGYTWADPSDLNKPLLKSGTEDVE